MTDERPETPNGALSREEENFAHRTGKRLRHSADDLDAATLSRLNRARQAALEEMNRPSHAGRAWWVPAGVTALAAAVVVGIWRAGGPRQTDAEFVPLTADDVADFEILLAESELEMLEDLEFFAWLAAEELETSG